MIDKHDSDAALASPPSGVSPRATGPSPRIGAFIVAGALAMLALCVGLYLRAASRTSGAVVIRSMIQGPVTAKTSATSAVRPDVMNCFTPCEPT